MLLDLLASGDGMGIGKTAETADLLDIGWAARIRGNLTVDGSITVGGDLMADHVVAQGNSNTWNYIKFAAGLAICARTIDVNGAYVGTAVGNIYRSGTAISSVSYPFSFTGPPTEIVNLRSGSKYVWVMGNSHNTMTLSAAYCFASPVLYNTSSTAVSGRFSQIVIGRWR